MLDLLIECKETPSAKTFSDLPLGMFKTRDIKNQLRMGYKLGPSAALFFENKHIIHESEMFEDCRRNFFHLPNVEIRIREF